MGKHQKRPQVRVKFKIDELFHRFMNSPGVYEKLLDAHSLALRGINPLDTTGTATVNEKKRNAFCSSSDEEYEDVKLSPRPPSAGTSPRGRRADSTGSTGSKSSIAVTEKPKQPKERIPRFYFPTGMPREEKLDPCRDLPESSRSLLDFELFCERAKLPKSWRILIPWSIQRDQEVQLFNDKLLYIGNVPKRNLEVLWQEIEHITDLYLLFTRLVEGGELINIDSPGMKYLIFDLINCQPTIAYLKNSPSFHYPYARAVIERLAYNAHCWGRNLTAKMIKRTDFLSALDYVFEPGNDVNNEPHFFSYEHFYVQYCEWFELDTRQTQMLTFNQLSRYSSHTVNPKVFSRMAQATNRYNTEGVDFGDFIWFIMSEEDKTHSTAIEFWFRILDFDGDGIVTMYDLQQFYYEQIDRISSDVTAEDGDFKFENKMDEILDRLGAAINEDPNELAKGIRLEHLKRAKGQAAPLIDTFISLDKYMDSESEEQKVQDDCFAGYSPWQNFVRQKYNELQDEDDQV